METAPVMIDSSQLGESSFLGRNRHLVDSVIDLTGGTAGGAACVYVGQPLDTVKVKMQTFPSAYRNSLHCFTHTLKQSGLVRGLYAGTVPSLAANVSENAILFMAYGMCQKTIGFVLGKKSVSELGVVQNAVAGSCAAFFSSLALCPTELVKCRLQVMKELQSTGKLTGHLAQVKNISSSLLVRHILRHEGIQGLFHGLSATFAREIPGYFFFFGGYEGCRTLLTPAGKTKDDLSVMQLLACGGMGGICFWVSVFPTDVMKSRIQVSTHDNMSTRTGYWQLVLKIIREEGVVVLYKGLGPTLVRTFFATGALFFAYENTKKCLTGLAYGNENSQTIRS